MKKPRELTISYKIPCEIYLYNFICKRIGSVPFILNSANYHSKLLLGQMALKLPSEFKFKGDAEVEVLVPVYYFRKYKIKGFLPQEHAGAFIQYFDSQFRESMFEYVETRLEIKEKKIPINKIKIKESMVEYLQKFGAEEENLPFETLKKAFFRRSRSTQSHNSVGAKKFATKLSPNFLDN